MQGFFQLHSHVVPQLEASHLANSVMHELDSFPPTVAT